MYRTCNSFVIVIC